MSASRSSTAAALSSTRATFQVVQRCRLGPSRLLEPELGALVGAVDPVEDLRGRLGVEGAGPGEELEHVGGLSLAESVDRAPQLLLRRHRSANGTSATDDVIEEVGIVDALVHEVDVRPHGEAGVRVAEPRLDLLDVLAAGEQERRARVAEAVERDPRNAGALAGGMQDVAPEACTVDWSGR